MGKAFVTRRGGGEIPSIKVSAYAVSGYMVGYANGIEISFNANDASTSNMAVVVEFYVNGNTASKGCLFVDARNPFSESSNLYGCMTSSPNITAAGFSKTADGIVTARYGITNYSVTVVKAYAIKLS